MAVALAGSIVLEGALAAEKVAVLAERTVGGRVLGREAGAASVKASVLG